MDSIQEHPEPACLKKGESAEDAKGQKRFVDFEQDKKQQSRQPSVHHGDFYYPSENNTERSQEDRSVPSAGD